MKHLTYGYDESISPALPVLEIEIEGYQAPYSRQRLTAIVDSGADSTALPRPALVACGAAYRDTVRMRGVTGVSRQVDRFLTMIHIGEVTVRGIYAVALPAGSDPLLGRDALNQLVLTLNGPAHVIELAIE